LFISFFNQRALEQKNMSETIATTTAAVPEEQQQQQPILLVKLLSESAKAPKRATEFSAGYDLCSAQPRCIPPHSSAVLNTDVALNIPDGFYGRIASRSSLAAKHGIEVGGGVIDADYRGNIGVILFNHSDAAFNVGIGDRIAQIIMERNGTPEVKVVPALPTTARGAGGFGSTGK